MAKKRILPLERMTFENIQSIATLDLKLGATTSLFGPSDVGKSISIRALYAAITRGNLTPLRRAGTNQCSMTLEANGTRVVYDEGGYEGTDGKEPISSKEEVQEALMLPEIAIDRDITLVPNVKVPLTPPFLVVDPPAQAAKVLGMVSGVHVVLAAQREAKRRLGIKFKDRAGLERRQESLEESLRDLVDVPERLRLAEDLKDDLADLMGLAERLEGLKAAHESFMGSFEEAREAHDLLESLTKVEAPDLGDLPELWDRLQGLRTAVLEVDETARAETKATKHLKKSQREEEAAVEALREVIRKGRPCPYTSFKLPGECATVLAEEMA